MPADYNFPDRLPNNIFFGRENSKRTISAFPGPAENSRLRSGVKRNASRNEFKLVRMELKYRRGRCGWAMKNAENEPLTQGFSRWSANDSLGRLNYFSRPIFSFSFQSTPMRLKCRDCLVSLPWGLFVLMRVLRDFLLIPFSSNLRCRSMATLRLGNSRMRCFRNFIKQK